MELCRFYLRKLILIQSQKNPKKTKEYQKEILNNFFTEVELFAPIFTLVPQRIFSAIISIIFSFFFLSGLRQSNDNFTTYFILILSLILITLIYFSYQVQVKIHQKENKFRRQENALFEEYLQKQKNPQRVEKEIDKDFYQIRYSF